MNPLEIPWYLEMFRVLLRSKSKTNVFRNNKAHSLMSLENDGMVKYKAVGREVKSRLLNRTFEKEIVNNFDLVRLKSLYKAFITRHIYQIDRSVLKVFCASDNKESLNDLHLNFDTALDSFKDLKCEEDFIFFISETCYNKIKTGELSVNLEMVNSEWFYKSSKIEIFSDEFLEYVYKNNAGEYTRRCADLICVPVEAFMNVAVSYEPYASIVNSGEYKVTLGIDYDTFIVDTVKPYMVPRNIDLPVKRCVICDEPLDHQSFKYTNNHYICSNKKCVDKYIIAANKEKDLKANDKILVKINNYRKLSKLPLLDITDLVKRMD